MINTFDDTGSLLKRFFYKDYLKTPDSVLSKTLFFMIYNKAGSYSYVIGTLKEGMNELLEKYEIEVKPGLSDFISEVRTMYAVDIGSLSTETYKIYVKRFSITDLMRQRYTIREEINEDTTVFYYDVQTDTVTHYKHYLSKPTHHVNMLYKVGNPDKLLTQQKCNIFENTDIYFKDELGIVETIDKHKYFLSCSYRDNEDKSYLYVRKRGKQ